MEGLSRESHSNSTLHIPEWVPQSGKSPQNFINKHTVLIIHPQQLSTLTLSWDAHGAKISLSGTPSCSWNPKPLWTPPRVNRTRVIFTSGISDATESPQKRRIQPKAWIQSSFVPKQNFIQQRLLKKAEAWSSACTCLAALKTEHRACLSQTPPLLMRGQHRNTPPETSPAQLQLLHPSMKEFLQSDPEHTFVPSVIRSGVKRADPRWNAVKIWKTSPKPHTNRWHHLGFKCCLAFPAASGKYRTCSEYANDEINTKGDNAIPGKDRQPECSNRLHPIFIHYS